MDVPQCGYCQSGMIMAVSALLQTNPKPSDEQLADAIPHYLPRHLVKPGMTGWAQINGHRGDSSLRKRLQYDLYYLNNWSPMLDLRIVLATPDLDGLFARLEASGADVVQEPTEQSYGIRDCAFRDPAGNLIRINELR